MIVIHNFLLTEYIWKMAQVGEVPISQREEFEECLGVGGKREIDELDQGHELRGIDQTPQILKSPVSDENLEYNQDSCGLDSHRDPSECSLDCLDLILEFWIDLFFELWGLGFKDSWANLDFIGDGQVHIFLGADCVLNDQVDEDRFH